MRRLATLLGGVAVAPELLARALAEPAAMLAAVPAEHLALLAEMADTIIPDTDTPGAKAAKVEEFIALAAETILPLGKRKRFWDGLTIAEEACERMHGRSFAACSPAQRTVFFQKLEADERAQTPDEDGLRFFESLKSMTVFGYFTSEIGATQALNYDPVPGEWIPDMKADEQTKNWASIF